MAALRFLLAHRVAAIAGLALLLIGIVILQNLEPIRFDLLFWSFPALPKLVVIRRSARCSAKCRDSCCARGAGPARSAHRPIDPGVTRSPGLAATAPEPAALGACVCAE
jgi:hypothetical protein